MVISKLPYETTKLPTYQVNNEFNTRTKGIFSFILANKGIFDCCYYYNSFFSHHWYLVAFNGGQATASLLTITAPSSVLLLLIIIIIINIPCICMFILHAWICEQFYVYRCENDAGVPSSNFGRMFSMHLPLMSLEPTFLRLWANYAPLPRQGIESRRATLYQILYVALAKHILCL